MCVSFSFSFVSLFVAICSEYSGFPYTVHRVTTVNVDIFGAANFRPSRGKPYGAYSSVLIFTHIRVNSICSIVIIIFTHIKFSCI